MSSLVPVKFELIGKPFSEAPGLAGPSVAGPGTRHIEWTKFGQFVLFLLTIWKGLGDDSFELHHLSLSHATARARASSFSRTLATDLSELSLV
eukprot:2818444-Pyramimonas_sp.AAC.1